MLSFVSFVIFNVIFADKSKLNIGEMVRMLKKIKISTVLVPYDLVFV